MSITSKPSLIDKILEAIDGEPIAAQFQSENSVRSAWLSSHVRHFERRPRVALGSFAVGMLVAAEVPSVRHALRAGRRDGDDAWQRPERHPAAGVGLQRRYTGCV